MAKYYTTVLCIAFIIAFIMLYKASYIVFLQFIHTFFDPVDLFPMVSTVSSTTLVDTVRVCLK